MSRLCNAMIPLLAARNRFDEDSYRRSPGTNIEMHMPGVRFCYDPPPPGKSGEQMGF